MGGFAIGVSRATPELGTGARPVAGSAKYHRLAAKAASGCGGGMDPIGRIRRIGPIFCAPVGDSRGGELLAVSALVDEIALESPDLAVEKVIGLVDQADDRIGDGARV